MTIGRLRSLNFERPTPLAVGQLLNQTGIDELSQLFDVLRGEMSTRPNISSRTAQNAPPVFVAGKELLACRDNEARNGATVPGLSADRLLICR